MKPECIIFDEPTAMLDPKGRTDVMNIIAKLHKEGITIILITHFMEEACEADRIIIMNNGTVISDGKPAEIFSRPELIQEAGLEIPAAVRIAAALRKRGLEVPPDVLTNEALAEWLCSQKTSEEKKTVVKTNVKHTAEKSAPRISVEHLTYIYNKGRPDETLALDDVSFTIEPGGFTGIIGHTGSGKSTLIQHLNGLLKPDSGSVIPEPSGENRKKTGLVFQYPEYQLFEENVARDVAFGPKNLGLDEEEIERRVKEAMELTGLSFDIYAERSPFELSGGQKRRAAIAGVIAMQPEVLILDEPTAGLDPQSHMEILDMIEKIRRERGCSIVLVSHNMDDVARLCTKVIVMDHGKLVLQGTPEEVFRQDRMLKNIGLGLPSGGELIYAIRQKGISSIGDALDETQAVDAISDYFGLSGR
jgi:energy-coupling factor transport system ATP-binding protein